MRRLCCWLAIKWSCVSAAPEHCGSIGCGGWTSCCFTTSHEVTMHQIHSWKRISTASIRAHLLQAPATGGSLEDNLPRTKLGDIFLVDEYSRKEALDIPGCLHLQCALVQCTELNCSIFNLAHSRQRATYIDPRTELSYWKITKSWFALSSKWSVISFFCLYFIEIDHWKKDLEKVHFNR